MKQKYLSRSSRKQIRERAAGSLLHGIAQAQSISSTISGATDTCHLRTIPREVRDMIYIEVLAPSGLISLRASGMNRQLIANTAWTHDQTPDAYGARGPLEEVAISFSILRTCKAIYHEARNVFYKQNCLEIPMRSLRKQCTLVEDMSYWESQLLPRFESMEISFGPEDTYDILICSSLLGFDKDYSRLRRLTLRHEATSLWSGWRLSVFKENLGCVLRQIPGDLSLEFMAELLRRMAA
ncbi:hypothetical protein JHW43_001839 [Diplocarpon mali]|nr:hypothetical protein JHW43_001839 [Diplocarpon mali]